MKSRGVSSARVTIAKRWTSGVTSSDGNPGEQGAQLATKASRTSHYRVLTLKTFVSLLAKPSPDRKRGDSVTLTV